MVTKVATGVTVTPAGFILGAMQNYLQAKLAHTT